MEEVVAFVEERFAGFTGEGVGETVAQIQFGFVAATFAKVTVGLAGDAGLRFSDGLNGDAKGDQKIVEFLAQDRIPVCINHRRGFYEVAC